MKKKRQFKIKFTLEQCKAILEELNQIRENYPENNSNIVAVEKTMRIIERSEKVVQLGEGWAYRIGDKCIPIVISYIGKAVMELNGHEITCTLKGQILLNSIDNEGKNSIIPNNEEIPIYSTRLIPIGYRPVSKTDYKDRLKEKTLTEFQITEVDFEEREDAEPTTI